MEQNSSTSGVKLEQTASRGKPKDGGKPKNFKGPNLRWRGVLRGHAQGEAKH